MESPYNCTFSSICLLNDLNKKEMLLSSIGVGAQTCRRGASACTGVSSKTYRCDCNVISVCLSCCENDTMYTRASQQARSGVSLKPADLDHMVKFMCLFLKVYFTFCYNVDRFHALCLIHRLIDYVCL